MSVDTAKPAVPVPADPSQVMLVIDGVEVTVPKGSLVIRATEKLGIAVPRFCDHPLLEPMGACRQCMVEIPDAGNGRGFPKPQAACVTEVAQGMVVKTQVTSAGAKKAQAGILEFLLINHPLDCPVCDKGGECPLQNQVMAHGYSETRFGAYAKRTFPKPVPISAQILLDRERCVLCARCTRFSEQISGDPFIALVERGALQQVGQYEFDPYDSYFSGNVVQICPVGALTSVDYRFQARPFDLVSVPGVCEHCASGCALRIDQRHFQVKRRLAGDDMAVNEEWNCDKGRFAFHYGRQDDRLTTPLVRDGGVLRPASWPEAIDAACRGLAAVGTDVGVLTGGRLTVENAYAYSKFARVALGTNNIDFRSRPHTVEEGGFLANAVAGRTLDESLTYEGLAAAKRVVLVGFEPEEESPIVFLRLRRAVRKAGLEVVACAPFLSNGNAKLKATLVATVPGTEADVLRGLDVPLDPDTVVLVGERAALARGALNAAAERCLATGAKLAWIPRRAGDLGAVEAGCLPNLLPGGRPVTDAAARVDVAAAWGAEHLPAEVGLDADAMLAGARAFVVAGVEPRDARVPHAVRSSLEDAAFVVSLEARASEVTERADVVFPVALIEEQSGTFLNWEHRPRPFGIVARTTGTPMTDLRVLAMLADGLGKPLGFRTTADAARELAELGAWRGERAELCAADDRPSAGAGTGEVLLATWRMLLDEGRGQDGVDSLAETAPRPVLRVSAATAQRWGLGQSASLVGDVASITLPVAITPRMVDGVAWVPTNAGACCVTEALQAVGGDAVRLETATEGGVHP